MSSLARDLRALIEAQTGKARRKLSSDPDWEWLRGVGGEAAAERFLGEVLAPMAENDPHSAVHDVLTMASTLEDWPASLIALAQRAAHASAAAPAAIWNTKIEEAAALVTGEASTFRLLRPGSSRAAKASGLTVEEAQGLCALMWLRPSLTAVELSRRLSVDAVSAALLGVPSTLTSLSLDKCDLTQDGTVLSGLKVICAVVSGGTSALRSLSLAGNHIPAAAGALLGSALRAAGLNDDAGREGSREGGGGGEPGGAAPVLSRVCLSTNELGDAGVAGLVGALTATAEEAAHSVIAASVRSPKAHNKAAPSRSPTRRPSAAFGAPSRRHGLVSIDLSVNGIGPKGAEAVSTLLLQGPSLTQLNVDGNSFGPEGAASLARGLAASAASSASSALAQLSVSWNGLGDAGAVAIGRTLSLRGVKLERLELARNDIGNVAAAVLGDCLALSPTLSTINFCGNRLCGTDAAGHGKYTYVGVRRIGEAIVASASLTSIDLRSCGLSRADEKDLQAMVEGSARAEQIIIDVYEGDLDRLLRQQGQAASEIQRIHRGNLTRQHSSKQASRHAKLRELQARGVRVSATGRTSYTPGNTPRLLIETPRTPRDTPRVSFSSGLPPPPPPPPPPPGERGIRRAGSVALSGRLLRSLGDV